MKKPMKKKCLKEVAGLSALIAGALSAGNVLANDISEMLQELDNSLKPAQPIEITKAAVEQAMTVRESFGLNSDPEFVRSLLSSPERYDALSGALTGGHYVTPDEVEQIKLRLVLQEDAIRLLPVLQEDPDFAGLYISRRNVINVGFTFDAEAKVGELREKVMLPERIQAFSAQRSMIELEETKKRVLDISQELAADGIVVSEVSIDVEANRIKVGIADLDPELRESLRRIFGDVDLVDTPLAQAENRSDTADPMRAGVRITNVFGGSCTSNWKAQDRTTGELVSITAGHCVNDVSGTFGGPGADFFQGTTSGGATRQIGTSDQTTWTFPVVTGSGARTGSDTVDALRVPFDSGIASLPWLYAHDNANNGAFANGEEVRVGDVDGAVVVGSVACSGGQFSPANQIGGSNWKNCGTVTAVNTARVFIRTTGSPDRFTVQNANIATYTATGGDSGAPIWRVGYTSSQGWHAIALGHHSGGPAGAEIFNDIDRVEDALNVDVRFY